MEPTSHFPSIQDIPLWKIREFSKVWRKEVEEECRGTNVYVGIEVGDPT